MDTLPTAAESELIARQIAQEEESLTWGISRYFGTGTIGTAPKEAGQKEEAALPPGQALIRRTLEPMANALIDFIERASTGGAGRRHAALPYLAQVDPFEAAYITARCCLNGASEQKQLQTVAVTVAATLQDHLNLKAMGKTDAGLYRKLMQQVAHSTSAKHRLGVLRNAVEKYGTKALSWSGSDRVLVGLKLVELFVETSGLVVPQRNTTARHKTPIVLTFTEETAAWLAEAHDRASLTMPAHLPMLVAPRPWRNPYRGGYLSDHLRPRLVKSRSRGYMDELGSIDLSRVFTAVNAVQATAWRVNSKVLDVMIELHQGAGNVAGLPPTEDLPLPPRPEGVQPGTQVKDLPLEQQEAMKHWKGAAAKVHAANGAARSARVQVAQKLFIGKRYAAEAAIWFPHSLDFRGRVYPMANYVNPQGDDVAKGMLEFANGKALGIDGAYWLAIHMANCWGVDKVSFDARVEWVMEHEADILACAIDPFESRFWQDADSPFQALAAAYEWAGYKLQGDAFVSHLAIGMDGSCSGLQHFSALLLDEVGGAAVNLVPGAIPADIYTAVANRAQAMSDGSPSEMAAAWEGKVCRKIAKQPTMTMCYSATKYGMKLQIEDAIRKLDVDHDGAYLGHGVDRHQAAGYMAELIWAAIGEVVIAARRAMDWLQAVSAVAAEADMPIRWVTPMGLPVMQEYRDQLGRRVDTHFGGQRIQVILASEGDKINRRRQASGIAPNFVHSLDSAHLMATVELGVANGLTDFAMIHDSFGTHAADTSLLNVVLRESFVAQYSVDLLASFRADIVAQLEVTAPELVERIPPVPAKGSLDLAAVKGSDFFFA